MVVPIYMYNCALWDYESSGCAWLQLQTMLSAAAEYDSKVFRCMHAVYTAVPQHYDKVHKTSRSLHADLYNS